MDRISNLPSVIIENILRFLAIQEAGRTSILSQEWRCHWMKIPKLTITEATFPVSTDGADLSILEKEFDTQCERIRMFRRRKFFYAINQLLSKHDGPIHEFTLSMELDDHYDEIDHILSHLAQRNTVKKLKLHLDMVGYTLPLSVFSFRQLTDLCLEGCFIISPPTTIDGFGSLTRLSLQNIYILNDALRHLLCNCRFLKSLTLGIDAYHVFKSHKKHCCIINLFECFPVVESLSISLCIIQ
ncbi:F-box/FBD/LRR-repeat protein, partial [Tanacetum coccineum]